MKIAGLVVAVLVAAVIAFATIKKVSPVGWGWWGTTNTSAGVALKGYDPVAYFEARSAVQGDANNAHDYADATWHFANAANRELFAADPERYAPQFGSFCSFAVSKGFTADADPEAWHVEAGRLYVFADKNVRDQWVSELGDGSLKRSERNWKARR